MFREPIDEPDPEPSELRFTPSEMTDLIQHLYSLEKQYGIVVTFVTRGDIEDAWRQDHFADDKEAPPFTDEMWDKAIQQLGADPAHLLGSTGVH